WATLGIARTGLQPQRGYDPEPRVAALGYPGNCAYRSPTPTGLRPRAQGCRFGLPWELRVPVSNPNGVTTQSPGLPLWATLGISRTGLQPQRGYDPEPRVAALGYPGNCAYRSPTPTGLRPRAQGCRFGLPWELSV